jgi:hypothetical protein
MWPSRRLRRGRGAFSLGAIPGKAKPHKAQQHHRPGRGLRGTRNRELQRLYAGIVAILAGSVPVARCHVAGEPGDRFARIYGEVRSAVEAHQFAKFECKTARRLHAVPNADRNAVRGRGVWKRDITASGPKCGRISMNAWRRADALHLWWESKRRAERSAAR